jgi:hypothetical protein
MKDVVLIVALVLFVCGGLSVLLLAILNFNAMVSYNGRITQIENDLNDLEYKLTRHIWVDEHENKRRK